MSELVGVKDLEVVGLFQISRFVCKRLCERDMFAFFSKTRLYSPVRVGTSTMKF